MDRPGTRRSPAPTAQIRNGLELDRAAVNAGLTLPLKHGRTEGVNTRTKRIMGQMHGRAVSDLLRQRILFQWLSPTVTISYGTESFIWQPPRSAENPRSRAM